jgi:hypothetical protein
MYTRFSIQINIKPVKKRERVPVWQIEVEATKSL